MSYKNVRTRSHAPIRYYQHKINELKKNLLATGYAASKYAKGLISEEEYAPIKAERESYRVAIREAEAKIAELKQGGTE